MDTLPLKRDLTLAYRTSLLIALLMVVVSAGGLAWGSTSLYGVDQDRALGVSASTAGVLVPGFLIQDVFNLAIGLPILVGVLWLARRGSLIGLLLWPGALFYLVYTYVHYLVGAPFSALFLGYVAIVALSAYTTIGLVASIDCDTARQRLAGAVRPRLVGGVLVGLALLTVGQDAGGAVATALAAGVPRVRGRGGAAALVRHDLGRDRGHDRSPACVDGRAGRRSHGHGPPHLRRTLVDAPPALRSWHRQP